jgi:RNA 2',3'-cyclic 3'-phosphodiesterase
VSVRCFAAVEVAGPTLVAELGRVQDELRRTGAGVKWVRPDQFHLTLKFLGEIPEAEAAAALDALRLAAAGIGPFELEVCGLGAFPGPDRPRVIWAGIAGGKRPLEELAAAVEKQMQLAGFPPEQRRFAAHLTLGRVREGGFLPPQLGSLIRAAAARRFGSHPLTGAVLLKSELRPAGPLYTPIGHAPFHA